MPYPTKKLGDVAEVIMGQSPPSSSYNEQGEGLPFFQGKAEFGEIYPTPVKYCSSPSRIAEANDVLISVRAPVGNINIAREKSCVGRGLGALRAKKNILNQMFLFYFMKKNENNWSRLSTGSTFSAIKGSSLKNFEIPLPPLEIQKQIVERLDKVAEAQKLNDGLIQKSDELFQSLLHKELNPAGKDWEIKKLGDKDVIEIIDGDRGKNYPPKNEFQKTGFCLFLNTKNVTSSGFIFAEVDFIPKERDKKLRKGKLQRNDIVLTTRGTIGNSALYDDSVEFDNVRINSGMVILRPNTKQIIPKLLWILMGDSMTQKQFKRILSGTAQPQLPITNLVKIKIPLPPLETQKQIVQKLSAVQEYKTGLIEQRKKLKELFESSLHKSMSNK